MNSKQLKVVNQKVASTLFVIYKAGRDPMPYNMLLNLHMSLYNIILWPIKSSQFDNWFVNNRDFQGSNRRVWRYYNILFVCGKRWDGGHWSLLWKFTVATMIWLTVMEYLCHKWPRICSTCHKYFPVLSSFTTYYAPIEEFEDTKGSIRIHISKKNRQHNGQKKKYKRTNNDLENIHIKLKIK
jgi:hypothetical protein